MRQTLPKPRLTSDPSASAMTIAHEVVVDEFTDGVLDPAEPMLGPLSAGGTIFATTAPGCWGPMITPAIRGGHEVTRPIAVAGAVPGDALVVHIEAIEVLSMAAASGTDRALVGRFHGDPYVAASCPQCGAMRPATSVRGTGPGCIRCDECGADASPFAIAHGYSAAFDKDRTVGITLDGIAAAVVAGDAAHYAAIPEKSVQNSVLALAPHDLVGVAMRLRPFLGQLGTTPAIRMPDSHNAGDFGTFLIDAPHEFALSADQLELRTDGHMDVDAVRAGAIVICPVKVPGGGVYLGDMHAMQGDGEIAGHTCDVAGTVRLRIDLIKGLTLDGPILLPVSEDLPYLARPLDAEEFRQASALAKQYGQAPLERSAPLSFIGSGANLNAATDNGVQRAAALLGMSLDEVKNRVTITGGVEIGRHPGIVQVTLLVPCSVLKRLQLLPLVRAHYQLD